MRLMERTYTIKEAAEQTGVSAHTLRYYERIGLLEPIQREASGRRRYRDGDLEFPDHAASDRHADPGHAHVHDAHPSW